MDLDRAGKDVISFTVTDPPTDDAPLIYLEQAWHACQADPDHVGGWLIGVCGPDYAGSTPANGVRLTRTCRPKVDIGGVVRWPADDDDGTVNIVG